MSYALEARNPMLDHRVVQFMLSLPAQYKVRPGTGPMTRDGLQNKWLLHALAKRYLPDEAFDRPKRGFTPPIQQWIARYADRIASIFRQTDTLTAPLYSDAWRQYLTQGRYDPAATMAVYYSLVFALWARRYADHIDAMVGEKPASSSATGAKPRDTMMHRVYRTNDPAAIATARWFCQALGNIATGSTARIIGDEDGTYRWLAEQSGLTISEAGDPDATIVIGLDTIASFDPDEQSGQLLLFVPFLASEQGELNALLQKVNASAPIRGSQAVPIAEGCGVLIARCDQPLRATTIRSR